MAIRSAQFHGQESRPKNWLVPVILLSLHDGNSYGYALMETATTFGLEEINSGTFYRILRQMEKDGFCKSAWDTSKKAGPQRRTYSLTDAGEAHLVAWAKSIEQYERIMVSFFELYSGGRSCKSTGGTEKSDEEFETFPQVTPRVDTSPLP